MVVIKGDRCLSSSEGAAMLGVSMQTIWRYATERERPERRIKAYLYKGKYYIPISELCRFRDEIRPTFKGGPGRPKGSKDRKRRTMPQSRPSFLDFWNI